MTGELSIDYSYARPSPAAISAAGYEAVIRYLSGGGAKDLTASEAAALHAAGLGIGLVWETTADRALGGGPAGAADGAAAVRQAQALGYPAGCVLWVNLGDFAGGSIAAVQAYYFAFRRVPGFVWQAGGYATAGKIGALVADGAQGTWWQNAMDDGGVSGSTVDAGAAVYQRVRPTRPQIAGTKPGDYDEDIAVGGTPVAWWRPAPPAPPASPAQPWQAQALAAAQKLEADAAALAALIGAHQ